MPRVICLHLAALLVALAAPALAQAGDAWTNPQNLGPPGSFTEDNSAATTQPNEPLTIGTPLAACPGVTIVGTQWYRLNGTGLPITVRASRIPGSRWSGAVAVYRDGAPPSAFTFIGCRFGDVTFDSWPGAGYLVQVGSEHCMGTDDFCDAVGYFLGARRAESFVPPANDKRLQAAPVKAGETVQVGDTRGATVDAGEHSDCKGAFGHTVWFRYDVAEPGTATFTATLTAADYPLPVVAVHREGSATPLACNRPTTTNLPATVGVPVTAGTHYIQLGDANLQGGATSLTVQFTPNLDVDGDGSQRPADCDDANPAIHPGATDIPDNGIDENCDRADAIDLDRDDDGFARPLDCDDANRAIHPGATDIPDNGIDENCDRADATDPDRDKDRFDRPLDCDDTNPAVFPGAVDPAGNGVDEDCDGADDPVVPPGARDEDGDGAVGPLDCDDQDPRRHPGASEVPKNGIDEDCDGVDASVPGIGSTIQATFAGHRGGYVSFRTLKVTNARAGSRVTLTCAGRGCATAKRVRSVSQTSNSVDLRALVRGMRLYARTRIEVQLSLKDTVGVAARWRGRGPSRTDLCVPPGVARSARCARR